MVDIIKSLEEIKKGSVITIIATESFKVIFENRKGFGPIVNEVSNTSQAQENIVNYIKFAGCPF